MSEVEIKKLFAQKPQSVLQVVVVLHLDSSYTCHYQRLCKRVLGKGNAGRNQQGKRCNVKAGTANNG
jgi:hypothetical protein